jgi:hypothetical protein
MKPNLTLAGAATAILAGCLPLIQGLPAPVPSPSQAASATEAAASPAPSPEATPSPDASASPSPAPTVQPIGGTVIPVINL